jgi:predicted transcriptional regulator
MDEKTQIGEQQLDVLKYIVDRAPISANDVARQFGESHGLARTTVLTVIERLREKGLITRAKREGVWQYSPSLSKRELFRGLVERFVERTLGGSVFPVLAYLVDSKGLTPDEISQLREQLDRLDPSQPSPDETPPPDTVSEPP